MNNPGINLISRIFDLVNELRINFLNKIILKSERKNISWLENLILPNCVPKSDQTKYPKTVLSEKLTKSKNIIQLLSSLNKEAIQK